MKSIDQDISAGTFQRMYLLYGQEDYLKQQYKNKLARALVDVADSMNYSKYDGKNIDVSALIDVAQTLPFFSDRRLLLVEDSGFFKGSCEQLASFLPNLPESSVVVFVESEIDKRGKMYKTVQKLGHVAEFAVQKEDILERWILGRLKKEDKKITRPVLQLFLSKTGNDMGTIDRELEKLLCYVLEREVVTAEDVEAVCAGQVTNQIFEMVNCIGNRDQKRALELYYDLLALKEPPMRILYLILRQFRILMELKSMKKKNMDPGTMASIAGIPPFAVKKNLNQSAAFSEAELRTALEEGVALETDVKTGRIADQIAVELLIVTYSAKKEKSHS